MAGRDPRALSDERFEAIYREHFERVAAYLLARADRDVAADALSRTFEIAWRRSDDMPREPSPWLLGVARKVLSEARRGQGRRDALVERIGADLEAAPDHFDAFAERQCALAALACLSDPQREVLLLIAWDGLSQREAADALGCSRGAVAVVRRARRARPRRPLIIGTIGATTLLACAALAALLATGSAVSPAPADAVAFHTSPSGDLLASITDPFATRTRLNAAFAKQGLHITIRLIPVSPSAVGRVVYMSLSSSRGPQLEPLREGEHCSSGDADCAIGLRIPKGFTATATIGLGRPARPGETYESSGSAFAPGELLHCSGLLGATVAQALPALERHKLTIQWMEDIEVATPHSGVSSRARTVTDPPASYYIWGANLPTDTSSCRSSQSPGPPHRAPERTSTMGAEATPGDVAHDAGLLASR